MRTIPGVLRLHHDASRSHLEIARPIVASPTTAGEILRQAKLAGIGYPLSSDMTEIVFDAAIYPPAVLSLNKRAGPI
ncbi:hypothetical protein J5J83_01460 [Azoarcus sp. L1K30]|uniref:hypothetical protein n=1 Tax=Azoarcus sp. L1K30 TaxID=2820277 RepID=UPI001B822F45|nr:hypothetical protein [Azoarcus sp. L1K30]MBR0564781.1 hypothetical protein [Azoarcus sp. L1K30]